MAYETRPVTTTGTNISVSTDERRTYLFNHISWGAVIAGVVAALVLQLMLNMLGVGLGLASFNTNEALNNPDAQTASLATAGWFIVATLVASFVGGIAAGRLSGSPNRDTGRWHGLIAWCAGTLVIFYLLSTAIGGIVGGAYSAVSGVVGGAGKAVAQAAGAAGGNTDDPLGLQGRVRSLLGQGQNDTQAAQNDLVEYFRAVATGDQQTAQGARDRAVNDVARVANISPDEARQRLDQAQQQVQQAADQAKQQARATAEAARKAVSQGSIWGFVALLVGAIFAWFGGGVGTPRREMALAETTTTT